MRSNDERGARSYRDPHVRMENFKASFKDSKLSCIYSMKQSSRSVKSLRKGVIHESRLALMKQSRPQQLKVNIVNAPNNKILESQSFLSLKPIYSSITSRKPSPIQSSRSPPLAHNEILYKISPITQHSSIMLRSKQKLLNIHQFLRSSKQPHQRAEPTTHTVTPKPSSRKLNLKPQDAKEVQVSYSDLSAWESYPIEH